MSVYIARNFKWVEFACPCCGENRPISPHFIYLLQNLRDKLNQPICITRGGGLRCKKYNRRIKGYVDSPHLWGKAADIYVKGMNITELAKEAEKIGIPRIGLYPYNNFIHLDVVIPYPSASWCRDKENKYHYFKTLEEAIIFAKTIQL